MGLTFKLGTAAQVTTNYIPKANSNSFSNSLIFDNGSNIGIGASSFPTSSNRLLFLNAPSGAAAQFLLGEAGTSYAYLYGYGGDAGLFTSAAIPLIFGTNSAERMRITSAGNVGIGTSSPTDRLTVSGRLNLQGLNQNSIWFNQNAGGTSTGYIVGRSINSDDSQNFFFYDVAAAAFRMSITSGGSVLINTTTSNQGYPLEIQAGGGGEQIWLKRSAANAQIFMGGGTAAETTLFIRANGSNGVYMTANATSWTSNSDETIKDIIEPITNGLDKLKDIRTVIYKFKNDKEGSRKVGLIAQDVEKILPEAITKTYQNEYDKEVLGLNYTDLIPVLVKAVQELSAKVSALENKS